MHPIPRKTSILFTLKVVNLKKNKEPKNVIMFPISVTIAHLFMSANFSDTLLFFQLNFF